MVPMFWIIFKFKAWHQEIMKNHPLLLIIKHPKYLNFRSKMPCSKSSCKLRNPLHALHQTYSRHASGFPSTEAVTIRKINSYPGQMSRKLSHANRWLVYSTLFMTLCIAQIRCVIPEKDLIPCPPYEVKCTVRH